MRAVSHTWGKPGIVLNLPRSRKVAAQYISQVTVHVIKQQNRSVSSVITVLNNTMFLSTNTRDGQFIFPHEKLRRAAPISWTHICSIFILSLYKVIGASPPLTSKVTGVSNNNHKAKFLCCSSELLMSKSFPLWWNLGLLKQSMRLDATGGYQPVWDWKIKYSEMRNCSPEVVIKSRMPS